MAYPGLFFKQKSTLAVLAVFSLIWAGLGFWRAMAGDVVSMVMLFVILVINPSRHAESREPVSARSAAKVWKASVSARTWVKCDTALGMIGVVCGNAYYHH